MTSFNKDSGLECPLCIYEDDAHAHGRVVLSRAMQMDYLPTLQSVHMGHGAMTLGL